MSKKVLISWEGFEELVSKALEEGTRHMDDAYWLTYENLTGCSSAVKDWFDAQPDVSNMLVEDFLKISKYHRED